MACVAWGMVRSRWPAGIPTANTPATFLGLVFAFTLVLYRVLKRDDPELLASRMGPMFREGQARWDKVWLSVFVFTGFAWLVLAGLDGGRFGWSRVPTWLRIGGGLAFAHSLVFLFLVFRANTFLSEQEARLTAERRELGVSDEVAAVAGVTAAMLVTLGENGVKTLDDLADLANIELINPEDGVLRDYGLSEEEADAIIMAARAHWFDDEPEDADVAPADGAEDADGEPVSDIVPGG